MSGMMMMQLKSSEDEGLAEDLDVFASFLNTAQLITSETFPSNFEGSTKW